MTRFAALDPDALDADQRAVHDRLVSGPRGGIRGPFPALLQHPSIAGNVADLGDVLRFGTSFPPRLFELVVLVTARGMRCAYEWQAHGRMAVEAGLEPEVIEALRTGADPRLGDPAERLAHAFARELASEDHHVSDATYQAASAHFGTPGVVELAALIGYFMMVAATINAHELGVDPAAPSPFDDARAV